MQDDRKVSIGTDKRVLWSAKPKPADTIEFWFAKDSLPPDGNAYMHKFIHALLLRRPDAEIDKAVKENRWKDAYELEIKYQQEATMSIAADGPSFAEPATHPEGTSDEYVEDPDEKNICVLHGPMVTTDEWTGKPPPDGYAGPRPFRRRRTFGNQI